MSMLQPPVERQEVALTGERLWGLLASTCDGVLGSQSSSLNSILIKKQQGSSPCWFVFLGSTSDIIDSIYLQ